MAGEGETTEDRRKAILRSIAEGRKMDAYAEYRTKDMHTCWICNTICYKRPVKNIGDKWICIDCVRQLKELLDTIDQWEKEHALEEEARKKIDLGLGI